MDEPDTALHLMQLKTFLIFSVLFCLTIILLILGYVHKQVDSPYDYLDAPYALELLSEEEFNQATSVLEFAGTQMNSFYPDTAADVYINPEKQEELFLKIFYRGEGKPEAVYINGSFSYQNTYGLYDYEKVIHEPAIHVEVPVQEACYLYLTCPDPHAYIHIEASWLKETMNLDFSENNNHVGYELSKNMMTRFIESYFADGKAYDLPDETDSIWSSVNLKDLNGSYINVEENVSTSQTAIPNEENRGYYIIIAVGALIIFAFACYFATH